MKRDLKFRCWDERNKEMVYSYKGEAHDCFYVNNKGVLFMYALPKSETGLTTEYYKSYDVMQYTGMKDCKGKEIYEGDIVKGVGRDKGQSEVFYNYGVWQPFNYLGNYNESQFEVIGNKYENPELDSPLI